MRLGQSSGQYGIRSPLPVAGDDAGLDAAATQLKRRLDDERTGAYVVRRHAKQCCELFYRERDGDPPRGDLSLSDKLAE